MPPELSAGNLQMHLYRKMLRVVFPTLLGLSFMLFACRVNEKKKPTLSAEIGFDISKPLNSGPIQVPYILEQDSFLEYEITVPVTGRYRIAVVASADSGWIWVEDYVDNPDGRTYDISGKIFFHSPSQDKHDTVWVDGSPLQKGKHRIRIYAGGSDVEINDVSFSLLVSHKETPEILTQHMKGPDWKLKWSDEFEGSGLPDSTKWSYNIGNWGWGNNELQYYTLADTQNAQLKDGYLHIRAQKDAQGKWTSARLTTQGKTAFKYGRIEFRAMIPNGRGTWSAGWLLGDAYKDEISWPYCGEIDVLESVGFEFDSSRKHGINHASCHTRAYYFKQGNQITGQTPVSHMSDSFHIYAVEWYPDGIYAHVDGRHYYTYDKTANEQEWPFHQAQNIILNLAIGGGWGGAKGIDPEMSTQQLLLDYVRVYERR